MISFDPPYSPPPLPISSDLSGVHQPSLLWYSPRLYSPVHPMLPLDCIDDNSGNLSPAMNDFSGNSDCHGYLHDASLSDDLYFYESQEQFVDSLIGTHDQSLHHGDTSLPEDLYPNDSQEQFVSSLNGTYGASLPDDLFLDYSHEQLLSSSLIGTHGASLPDDLYPDYSHEQLLSPSLIDDLNEDNKYEDISSEFNNLYMEPLNATKQDVSAQDLHQPYGKTEFKFSLERISPIPSPPTTELNQVPNNFDKDFVTGMCLCKGCSLEGVANKEQEFGLNFETLVSYLTNKVADDLIKNDGDHISSEPNVVQATELFEQLPCRKGILGDDFAQCFSPTAKQNQALENALVIAETEGCNHKSCSHNGNLFNAKLEQVNSSLSAEISKLKTLVENLSCQVQDMSDKLSCQKKLSASYEDETAQDLLFCKIEDKRPKLYESLASISDWGAAIVDQSVIIGIATDYFPSRIIPTSPASELNQPSGVRQSAVALAVNGMLKKVGRRFQLSVKTKSAISATGQKANSAGSTMPKKKYIIPGVSFLSGAFNKVGRAATNVGSK